MARRHATHRAMIRLAAVLRRHATSLVAAMAVLLVLAVVPAAHAAVTCTATHSNVSFGTINPYSGYPYEPSATGTYACTNTGTTAATVTLCISYGTGTGGTTPSNRTLASGSNTIPVQVLGRINNSTQYGDGTSYPMKGPLTLSVPANGTANGSYGIFIVMPQPSSTPPPGTYTSSFSGTDAQDLYTAASAPSSCAALASGAHSTTPSNFSVSATVPTQCTVSASTLAFPTASLLTQPVTATATVSSTCNASTPVTLALDNGATGTGPTARQMKAGSNAITYGIYRDAAATLPWGGTSGTNTASLSSGTGTLTAYGLVPAQTSPPPGSYSDVVNVVITY